jgi:tripartite-type tricarboxylate transporter receptor subunit TctC
MKRTLARPLAALLMAAAAMASAVAIAQTSKVVKLVVPFPAGGTADVLPRILTEKLRTQYPSGVVVENKVGAGGNIGADFVARAEPDGTTFLVAPPGPIAINHHLYKSLSFDPTKWTPVTVLATVPNVLDVSNKLPVKDVNDFIAYLKANPGKVSFASQGNGSTSHLTAMLFMQLTGTNMIHVPYKGTTPALVDIIGGNVDVFFDNISSSAAFHQSGKLKVLAVADEHRSSAVPQVPTFAEAGLQGMNAVTFFAMVAPPGTPAADVAYAQKAVSAALAQPDVKQKFGELGAEARGWSPEQTGEFIRNESNKWNKVIKVANVTLD